MGLLREDVKAAWVADLRSGKFPQTKGQLRVVRLTDNVLPNSTLQVGYCCLGVLCETVERLGLTELRRGTYTDDDGLRLLMTYDDDESFLPNAVAEVAFLQDALFVGGDVDLAVDELIGMNDGGSADFSAIADWVEANL